METTRDTFENKLYEIWANYFECSPRMLKNSGLTIIPLEKLQGTGWVHLYQIGKRSLANCDIEVRDIMVYMMQINALRKGEPCGMTGADIQVELPNIQVEYEHVELLFYLYPNDFRPYTTSEFEIRQLFEDDKDKLDALKLACTPEDVSEGWVHVTDELAYGAFDGGKMVACATMYDWRGFADPGVLVHPDYRRRGLGKAVVSAICQWVLDKGRVMNYRCSSTNHGSAGIAKSLGFTQYFEIEVFKVVNNA